MLCIDNLQLDRFDFSITLLLDPRLWWLRNISEFSNVVVVIGRKSTKAFGLVSFKVSTSLVRCLRI